MSNGLQEIPVQGSPLKSRRKPEFAVLLQLTSLSETWGQHVLSVCGTGINF